ncbi:putative Ig domain-containing protein [Pedobacter nyackensis]|uniref:Ig-like domain-containing protein n=1 Tax=Pedobacter nyackensis TaxID=475255 RepID=UPI0029301333|nr:putative Ig domain-containing protein [Pedobacter nyackensis]
MKRTSTLLELFKKYLFLLIFFCITIVSSKSYAQAKERVYATSQSSNSTGLCIGCGVITPTLATDGSPYTKSTVNLTVALLGARVSQDLIFSPTNLTGSPAAVVKLGTGEKLLTANLLGGIKLQAVNAAGQLVGNEYDGNSGLLTLLAVGNQTEVFIPSPGVPYNRIRVTIDGGLVSAAASIDVYHAYYLKDATNINCDLPVDELHGISSNIAGLGGVSNPLNAMDGNEATYATLGAVAGVLGYTQQTVIFPGLSKAGDSVRVLMSTGSALVSADLLSAISIQTFNGDIPGTPVSGSGLLNLRLLSPGSTIGVVTFAPTTLFDRVQIRVGGVANVLNAVNLHEVSRSMALPTSIKINTTTTVSANAIACSGDAVVLSINTPEAGATYTWYTQATGGTGVTGTSFTPAALATGVHDFYVSGKRDNCTNETPRKLVRITVNKPSIPVVSVPLPICSGSNTTLAVNTPVAGEIYKWYELETGGSPVFTGTTFVTPNLAAGKSYYVESVIGACASVRTKVDVTVNPIPADAEVTLINVTISKGQSASLTAKADVGSTVNWYTTEQGGTPVATGNDFITPALNVNTTYYVGTQSAGGCLSANRIAVLVTVTNIDPGLACNVPNAQSNGVNGLLCVGCGVENPMSAIDADLTNFSSIRLAVGVAGSAYQRLIFPNIGVGTDSIRLELGIPGGLADVSVLGGITANVLMNGAVVKTYNLNSSLLNLSLLGGGRFKVTIPAGAAYNGIEIRLGAVVTALTTVNVYGATVIYPNPIVATTGLNICSGTGTTLTATPVDGTTLKWYADETGGIELASGNSYSPTGLTTSTTYYIQVGKGTCVNAERIPVKVNVNPAIVFPTTTLANANLASTYAKQITAATGGTPAFNYTVAPGTALPAGLSLSATGVISGTPTAPEDTYTFSILATDSKGCTAVTPFSLTIKGALSLETALLPNGTVGVVYPKQTLPEASGGTGPYTYSDPETSLPPGLDFDPATREITGTPAQAGTYVFPVTVTDANGNTKTINYTIVVRDPLALPPATLANGTVGIPYPTQVIPAATGGIGPFVYTVPADKVPGGLTFNPLTREITGTPTLAGTYTIPVTVTDGDGKTITRSYTIVVGNPLVLPPATLADGNVNVGYTSQPIPAATGGAGSYTYAATVASLPPGLTFNPTTRVISGTPTQSGLYSVSVTVTDGAGTKASNTYSLRVIGALNLPTMALVDGTVGTVYTEQTLPEVTGGTGPYTYTAANVPAGLDFNPLTRKLTGTPTTGGTFTFSVTAKDAANNSTTTTFTVKVKVDAPVVASTSICAGSTTALSVSNTLPLVTYNWYAATGNTPIFTGATYTTAALTANTTYYVEAVSGTATSSRTAVTVTARPTPALAVVSSSQSISAGQTATLQASAEAGNTISWFAGETGGVALGSGTSFTTPILNTTTTYYVETTNATGCKSATRVPVVVTVTSGPVNPNCNAATGQVTKIESLLCLLCGITDPSGSTDANANTFTTINLGVNVAGVAYQKMMFGKEGAATDSIRVDMEIPVGLADIGVLNGATITVYKGGTAVKVYPLNSSLLNLQLLSGNRVQATFPATAAFDAVEIRVGSVAGLLTNYKIYGATIIYPNPTVAATGQTICAGNTTTLTATANGGTILNWYAASNGGASLGNGTTFTTPILNASTTYYIEVSKAGCANLQRIPVKVNVTPAPAAPAFATVLPVCYGSTTSIAVSNPVTGVSYNWYTTAAGVTPVFTGTTFVTPGLFANTTYYVEAANPGCGVSTRTAVPVTVNPVVTLPQIQASATTVAPGQTVILNASSPDANVTFNWYTSANATTPIYTGATYVTAPLTANTTYYLEAKSNTTGCTSLSRVQVTITVDNSLPSPVPCEAAISETHDVNGVALLSAVFNPQLAVDGDTRTGSSLVMPVGLLGASVYQRLGFGSVSSAGDTVKVLLSAPGKLLSLGLLSSIRVSTYNGATSNNDALSLNSNLINLELLSNNSQALLSFVPAAAFDQLEVRLNSGLAGVLSTIDVNYAHRILVAPTLVVANPTICANTPATLTVKNPNAALTYKWYDSRATDAVALATGTTFNIAGLTTNKTYYVAATSTTGCVSYKTKVDVTVTPVPVSPTLVNSTITTCPGSDVRLEVANPLTGITYKWYDNLGVYQTNKDGATFIITNVTVATSYSVEAVSIACNVPSATKATAQITLNGLDKPVITPMAVTIKSGTSAVLTATSSTAGANFKWYDDFPLNTVVSTDARYITAVLNNPGNTPKTFTFYATAELAGGCPASAEAAVVVTVLPAKDPSGVPCELATVLVREGVDGVALLTGVFNKERATDADAESASSLVMPVGALGASVYQQVGFNGLSTIGDTVRVRISAPGKLLSLAVLPSIELTTFQGTLSNNDMLLADNPLIHLELLSGDSDGIISFVPTKPFDGIELRLRSGLVAALTTLDFNYAQRVLVAPKVTSANASACVGKAATLNVQNPSPLGGPITYTWYKDDGTPVGTGSSYTTETTLAAGTYDYFVTASRNDCASAKTKVTVTILPAPGAPVPVATNLKSVCPNVAVVLAVTPVAGVSFNWFDALTAGNQLATNTDTYTTAANLTPGVYNFYVEASNANSCISMAARTMITLTVKRLSTPADIAVTGADLPFCKDTKATLTASSAIVNPKFTWFTDAALTNPVSTNAVYEPIITANTTFYVSVSGDDVCDGGPANAKVVNIVVNPPAVAADINVTGADAPFCKGAKALLTASSTTVSNPKFTWYTDAALTNPVSSNAVYEPVVTVTTTYYVTVSGDNKCPNLPADAKKVTVTVNTPSVATDITVAGNDGPFCAGVKAKLTATADAAIVNPKFIWYSDAALTVEIFRGAIYEPTLTASTTYYVAVSGDNRCPNESGTGKVVAIVVNNPSTQADLSVAGNNAPFCKGTTAKFTASSTTVDNPVFTWYRDADLTDAVFTGPIFEPVLTASTTFYVTVRGTNRCESLKAGAKVVTVVINPPAVSADIAVTGNNAPFCAGTKALLTATAPLVTGAVFTWYKDAALTDIAATGPVFEPVVAVTTTYYVTVSGANKCPNVPGDAKIVTLIVNKPADASDLILSGADLPICAGATVKLNAASTTVTDPIFTWYTDAALTNAAFTGAVFEKAITATTTYYVTVKGANKCENLPNTGKSITVIVNTPSTAADITVTGNGTPFCAGAKATLTATANAAITNPKFIWYSDSGLLNEVFRGPVYEPTVTVGTTYYVTVSGDNRCPNTPANAKTVVIIVNKPSTAGDITIAGNDAPFCKGTKAKLTASSTTVNTPVFTWYRDANLTDVAATGPVFEPVLTATTTYYVTVRGSNQCENLKADAKVVTLTVNPPALAADITVAGTNTGFCAGSKAMLTASSTTVDNAVFTWYNNAALTDVAFTGPVFEPVLTATKTYYVTVRGSNRCENASGDAKIVTLVVNPPAIASDVVVAGAETPVCAGTTVKLTASSTTVTKPVFTWYSDAALTNAVFTGPVLEKALTETTTYYVTVKGDNRCENVAGTAKVVTVTVNPLPNTPGVATTGTTICSEEATTLTIQNAQAGITYSWYNVPNGGAPVGTGTSFTTGVLSATTDFYVLATSAAGCGTATGRVKVTVNVTTKPAVPAVALGTVNTCLGSSATLTVSGPVSGVTYNWYATAISTTILGSGTTFTTQPITAATTTFYVEAKSGNCISTSRTPVIVNAGAIPLPPPSVSGASDPLCPGSTAVLTVNNPDPSLKYTWYSVATGGTALADGTTFNVPVLNATTIYYVGASNVLTGCSSATRTAVTLTVSAKLAAPVVLVQSRTATSVTFAWAAIPDATGYEVSIDNGLTWIQPSSGAAGTSHLIAGLQPDQKVTIRVRAKGQLDCQLSDATTFNGSSDNPLGNEIFVPNTFTPNNDGKNDVLYVYGNTIAKMKFRIYNQWGQFLYESLTIQNGWDGTYKGQMQPNGVYVYYLDVEFNDGKKATKKGTVTLLR